MKDYHDFVVYAYSRSGKDRFGRIGTFYYIGKGRPYRPYVNKRRVKKPKDKNHIHILHRGLDNSTAVKYEKALVLFYGREDLYPEWGVLKNMTDGGEGTIGYTFTKSHREKISESNRGKVRTEEQKKRLSESKRGAKNPMYGKPSPVKGDKHHLYTPLNWFHPVCGEVFNKSASELIEMYPEQDLKKSHLGLLRRGELNNHRGWKTISCPINKEPKLIGRIRKDVKRYNWFHPICGEIYNKSCSELRRIFPEQSLRNSQLCRVTKGLQSHHRGWKPICSTLLVNQ